MVKHSKLNLFVSKGEGKEEGTIERERERERVYLVMLLCIANVNF